ncbi:hypothetical protein [Streptomyces sp. NPDC001980]|uniref:hypothetical protein n=1 Tax=Streptomyces sp. NPDC001980 TaxID=3157126 RepID=UPI0033278BFC
MKRTRVTLLAALGITAIFVTGCGSSGDEGLPVRLVNESAWGAHVLGCPSCGERGVTVEGDPDRTPGGGGGTYFGWTEERAWPVTYKVVVRGVESVCPVIDPEPGKADGELGTRDIIYVVDKTGTCVAGPASMDDV